ncbi:MAG: hypothetical protein MRY74_13030 [Neomegalonema sp.]|nr:hypothetical protein [Neomegalonema sp.]
MLGVLCAPSIAAAQTTIMRKYLETHKPATIEQAVRLFPYKQYLRTVPFSDIRRIERDRRLLAQRYGDGDLFIYHLTANFLRYYPVVPRISQLRKKITIGERYVRAKSRIGARRAEPYEMAGYFILSRVAEKLERSIKRGGALQWCQVSNTRVMALVRRLQKNKVHIAIDLSSLCKLKAALQAGKVRYVADRSAGLLLAIREKVRNFVGFPVQIGTRARPDFQLKLFRRFGTQRGRPHKMQIFQLFDRHSGRAPVGQVVFLHRPGAKAQYFARSVVRRFRGVRRPMAAFTGGFTNNYKKPEGLTVDGGAIVSAVLLPDRHGLVVVEKSGGIRAISLKRASIALPRPREASLVIKNPLHDLIAYSKLVRWSKKYSATIFQTQLLAFSNKRLIKRSLASAKVAERRLLALVTKGNQVFHVVFNIRKPYALAIAAEKAFVMLRRRDFRVDALYNLDTGGQDVMVVYDPRRRVIRSVRGRKGVSGTTNLLVYRY